MRRAEAKAPGKLYIAGEYAVVEAGYPAILVAVDRFLTVKITETENQRTLFSKNYTKAPMSWFRNNENQFDLGKESPSFSYLVSTIRTVEEYLGESKVSLTDYIIEIDSQLDGESGAKIGLGSSAAVTIAIIKALLIFYSVSFTPLLVYKLAAISHIKLNSNGSFGDLATASYSGWVSYSSLDKTWLKEQVNEKSIHETIHLNWPKLHIEQITPPENLHLLIGWTGSPASTTDLVGRVGKRKGELSYDSFLTESKKTVESLTQSFRKNDTPSLLKLIRTNRKLLNQMGNKANIEIETESLTRLSEIAENHGAAAKSSGAGGGDCGIALFDKENIKPKIIDGWEDSGITPLPLSVYTEK